MRSRRAWRWWGAFWTGALLATMGLEAQPFRLPTANRALFEDGGGSAFFVGTVGKPWTSGAFGCVRSEGWQLHEGIDIRCLERDARGESKDPVWATADGSVAYISNRPELSNYGKYVILRHQVDGMEVYSLYAHLREVRTGLRVGQSMRAGEVLGILGRTANTRQGISKDRAHLHFELNLLVQDSFARWHARRFPGQRNDHGLWNGRNLLGLDPRHVLLAQQKAGARFRLRDFIRAQPELCRVQVRVRDFPWVRRYAALVETSPLAEREGVVGYDLSMNFNGIPCRVTARAASEMKGGPERFRLLSVNEAEQARNRCGRLVTRAGSAWKLSTQGETLLDLLAYRPE